LLVYHSLDVVAVAAQWLDENPVLLQHFSTIGGGVDASEMRGWILFFIALHDLGKFDVRFQLKARATFQHLNPGLELSVADGSTVWQYWHGEHAFHWLCEDFNERFKWMSDDGFELTEGEEIWKQWEPWLRAVAGHHGVEPQPGANPKFPFLLEPTLVAMDKMARIAFVEQMANIFLHPASLSLDSLPPPCNLIFLAGFCCVCDWLGSAVRNQQDEARFTYVTKSMPLQDYLAQRQPVALAVLQESGLRAHTVQSFGMGGLFPDFKRPHQVQTLVPDLPGETGLTLMEAPTGSGKTEAALAYASRLLQAGLAESIIFALPTQATANAMFTRLVKVAGALFGVADIVLAHGKAGFNPTFIELKKNALSASVQTAVEEREAGIQCTRWLGESRKRVFLGCIGVCTVDQVLVSVLPVRHRFVRGFGLGKSVLIVDEVHAYDSYMYGLLEEVIRQQKAMHGSLILLSATLPQQQRDRLLQAWSGTTEVLPIPWCAG